MRSVRTGYAGTVAAPAAWAPPEYQPIDPDTFTVAAIAVELDGE